MKPRRVGIYTSAHNALCESALVTVISSLGAWKKQTRLIGGLVPRYLIRREEGDETLPLHAGTMDVDLVLDPALLTDKDAYRHLEESLLALGFTPQTDENGRNLHYRWRKDLAVVDVVVLDLLCDSAGVRDVSSGGERCLPMGLRGAHLALQDFVEVTVTAGHLDQSVTITEVVQVANIVPFLVLKALAYQDRREPKDAYDLIYALAYYTDAEGQMGPQAVADAFARRKAAMPDEPLFGEALTILREHFATDEISEGYRKRGARDYASSLSSPDRPSPELTHCRDAAEVVEEFLANLGI